MLAFDDWRVGSCDLLRIGAELDLKRPRNGIPGLKQSETLRVGVVLSKQQVFTEQRLVSAAVVVTRMCSVPRYVPMNRGYSGQADPSPRVDPFAADESYRGAWGELGVGIPVAEIGGELDIRAKHTNPAEAGF